MAQTAARCAQLSPFLVGYELLEHKE
uniref:Uncharacterized protein n=1 Tax=Arundo donax TaxID=35708 RepID=A0A0A9EJY4_ARUDO